MANNRFTSATLALALSLGSAVALAQLSNPPAQWETIPGAHVYTHPTNPDTAVRVKDGQWSITHDGGLTAVSIPAPFPNADHVDVRFDPTTEYIIFANSNRTLLQLAEGDAPTWNTISLPPALTCDGCPPIKFLPRDVGETVLLAAGATGLWTGEQHDSDIIWTHSLPLQNAVTAMALSRNHQQLALGTAAGEVFVEDGRWMSNAPRAGAVSSLAFREEPTPALFGAYQDPAEGLSSLPYVFVTHDGGQSWTSAQRDLPLVPVYQLFPVDGANEEPAVLYALLPGAVYRSVNDGLWALEAVIPETPSATIRTLELQARSVVFLNDKGGLRVRATAAISCNITVSPLTFDVPEQGGPLQVRVTTSAPACPWTVPQLSNTSPVTFAGAPSGKGSAVLTFLMAANAASAARTVRFTVAGKTVTATQHPNTITPCSATMLDSLNFPSNGGTAIIQVDRTAACGTISLKSSGSWLTFSPALATATGKTQITVRAAANSGGARTAVVAFSTTSGTLSVGPFNASQATGTCSLVTTSLSKSQFSSSGETASLKVATVGACSMPSLRSSVPWATLSPIVNGVATLTVAANSTFSSRSGQITATGSQVSVSGAPIPIQQAAAALVCAYHVSPTELSFGAMGGQSTVQVTANDASCKFPVGALATNAPSKTWLRASTTSDTGTTAIRFTADPASVQGRSGTIVVAGVAVNATQAASIPSNSCICTGPACGSNMQMGVSVSGFSAAGGDGVIDLLTLNSCPWILSGVPSWMSLTDGPSGIGNGKIRFRVLPNTTGASRSTTISSPQASLDYSGHGAQVVINQSAR